MKNPKKLLVIKKVPLFPLLALLNNLYADGADFVDLQGDIDDDRKQDSVTVAVPLDYMSKEARENFMEENDSPTSSPPPLPLPPVEEIDVLTEEDLKNLLNDI